MKRLGEYLLFLHKMFSNRESFSTYFRLFFQECISIGINSIFLIGFVSLFVGAVIALQMAYNIVSPLLPKYIIGLATREMMILEMAPTLSAIVFAGKVGSQISGGIGTMRITEQIDALEVMGINSASYLVLPKILAGMIMLPFLCIMAGSLGIWGGWLATIFGNLSPTEDYIYGIQNTFIPFEIWFAIIKSFVFGFIVTSISAFKGYNVKGGALEVGLASTEAVTTSCIAILAADFILADTLLS
ncbi:MlaE family ABC transporter permease [Flammeovirga kamogawensis]|uniref:ABC transporter permease n=1 Tax=Flammeovirga kamogawensis TaxID=373891 RepID=A0ABX8H154_9BACT|nr:ABC transporter permease [Flammeovirga kamogawensis]QWG09186.1 ABC transporter permease [Flammeovirga kamogawensis]TRX70112.1 ABC transporter permease [Flammeovirga kamogawensis]